MQIYHPLKSIQRRETMYMPGDPAPDVQLRELNGSQIDLSATWSHGSHALLVFLRHLG
ncbi:MAG: hypothetical protein JSV42_05745 [Chloroflexota bacterium]|nr:MAG: hypothetical protein JSV42_05745 [Chloroflexota bacterium]